MRDATTLFPRTGAAALAAALLFAGTAAADVRIRHVDEPALDVHVTPSGPWTVVGSLDSTVLNPDGDAFADGLPGSATRSDELLASWIRAATGVMRLSRWDGVTWTDWTDLREPDAVGLPRVAPLGDGWALTWQRAGSNLVIAAVGASHEGNLGEPVPLLSGLLLDATFVNDVEVVLFREPGSGRLLIAGILWSVPGVPSPVDILWMNEVSAGGDDPQSPRGGTSGLWSGARVEPSEWTDSVTVTAGELAWDVDLETGEVSPATPPEKPTGKPAKDAPKRGQRNGLSD